MFHGVSKLYRYVLGSEDDAEESTSNPRDYQPRSEARSASESTSESRYFTGTVTQCQGGYGMIDNEIYFSLEKVAGGVMPEVGAMVEVQAHRKHGQGGWRAERVKVSHQPEKLTHQSEIPVSPANTESTYLKHEEEHVDHVDEGFVVAMVTSVTDTVGHINNSTRFNFTDVKYEGYLPAKGDWVKAKEEVEPKYGSVIAKEVQPLRVMEFEGVIDFFHVQQQYGFVNTQNEKVVHFTVDVCSDKGRVRKGQRVQGKAAETSRGRCEWRAFQLTIAPATKEIQSAVKRYTANLVKCWDRDMLYRGILGIKL